MAPVPIDAAPRLLVASTVYGFETELRQICGVLTAFGYDVMNSHVGTVPVPPGMSNRDACLKAVADCDLFLGFVRPFYGSGIVGPRSITHDEVREAIRLNKPRWILADVRVTFARQLLRPFLYRRDGDRRARHGFQKTAVLDDLRVLEMYDDSVRRDVPLEDRTGHWVQEHYRMDDVLTYIDAQFADVTRVREWISSGSSGGRT